MNNINAALLMALVTVSLPAWAIDDAGFSECTVDSNCQQKTSTVKNGTESCRAVDNKNIILRQSEFRDGKLSGPFTCRSFTGQLVMEGHYKDGKLDGLFRDFSDHRSFNNITEGWRVRYFSGDKQIGVEFFADGQGKVLHIIPNCWVRDGSGSSYWEECKALNFGVYNQQVQKFITEQSTKLKAQANGPRLDKYENGQTKFSATLKDGRFDGPTIRYWKNGKINERSLYKNGELQQSETFFESGKPESVLKYSNDKEVSNKLFWENGQLRQQIETTPLGKSGKKQKTSEYYDNGKLMGDYEEVFDSYSSWGVRQGKANSYTREGELFSELNYENGQLQGVQKITSALDKRIYEDTYDKGVLTARKVFEIKTKKLLEEYEYFKDGSLKSEKKHTP